MPVISGFGALAELPWESVTDKIERRVLAGQQGMIVWWKMKAGAHAAAHRHPHEQIVWMLKGKMDFRIGNDRKSMVSGDVAVIPGNIEHEGIFPEDTEVIDIFAPPREDFLTSDVPPYMRTLVVSVSDGERERVRVLPLLAICQVAASTAIDPNWNGRDRTLVRIDFGLSAVPRIW